MRELNATIAYYSITPLLQPISSDAAMHSQMSSLELSRVVQATVAHIRGTSC
jgi:hypothetical protein